MSKVGTRKCSTYSSSERSEKCEYSPLFTSFYSDKLERKLKAKLKTIWLETVASFKQQSMHLNAVIILVVSCALWNFTYQVSPLLFLCIVMWLVTKKKASPLFKAANIVAGSLAIGLGFVVLLIFLVNISLNGGASVAPHWLDQLEEKPLALKSSLDSAKKWQLGTFAALIAGLALLNRIKPGWKTVSFASKAKHYLIRVWIIVFAITSFTFFGPMPLTQLEGKKIVH